jgi:uncharacterized protein YndB with AHSA1/START domain
MEKTMANKTDKVLEITELFNASPETVFNAWTDREEFSSWIGPEGFYSTFCEMDVRVGGKWRVCIQSPAGEDYWMQGTYIEISSPSKLVFTFEEGSGKAIPGEETFVTITFSKKGKKTEMKFVQTNFPTAEIRDSHYGGWSSAFNCLRNKVDTN